MNAVAQLGRGSFLMPDEIKITDECFRRAQDVGKVELEPEDRRELEDSLQRYMCLRAMDQGAINSRDAERALDRLKTHVNALIKEFEVALREGALTPEKYALQETFFLMSERMVGRGQRQFLKKLKALQAALEQVDPAEAKMSSKRGRRKSTALISFLNEAACIYEKAGGTATAYWSDHTGHEGSPFTDFVFELMNQCPEEFSRGFERGPRGKNHYVA